MITFPVSLLSQSVVAPFTGQTFTTVGTTSWTAPSGVTLIEYLVVGGGGGGGNGYDAGGGAGGGGGMVLTGTLSVTPGQSYTVTVGDGGAGGTDSRTNNNGTSGGDSVFASITALGGGYGGGSRTNNPGPAGSGAGLGGASQVSNTTAPTGGNGGGGGNAGGGGGGAGGAGTTRTNASTPGVGGAGISSSLSGSSVTYGAGGNGGSANVNNNDGSAGTANIGNGGGGGSATSSNSGGGGNGGSGIVIIKSTKGTLTNPGTSAQDILNSGQTISGWYYIQTSTMASPRQVYCNMTDQGGGWMLISYNPTASTTGSLGMLYPNAWVNGEGTLNRLSAKTMDLWFHNGTSQCTSVMKMATNTTSQVPLLANMTIANKVVYTNPNNLNLTTDLTNFAAFVNNTPMAGTWTGVKGHTFMSTSLSVNAPGDWMYNNGTSMYWTVCGPSTDLNSTGRSGNAQGTGSWMNRTSSDYYGLKDVAANTNSQSLGINSVAFYIK